MDDTFEYLEYSCKLSENKIILKCDKQNNIAFIEFNYIDMKLYKLYFFQLRKAIMELQNKKYTKIQQIVSKDEWNEIINDDKYTIIQQLIMGDIECYLIECNIEDIIYCILKGFGLIDEKN
jgi:hypothetical protein